MISRNNSIPSILLFTAIASSTLTPFTTARSHRAIASLETPNSIELRDRNAIALNTDKRLLNKFKVNGIGC